MPASIPNLQSKLEPFFERMRAFEMNEVTPFAVAPRGLSDDLLELSQGLAQLLAMAELDSGTLLGLEQETLFGSLNPSLRASGPKAIAMMIELAAFFREEDRRALSMPGAAHAVGDEEPITPPVEQ